MAPPNFNSRFFAWSICSVLLELEKILSSGGPTHTVRRSIIVLTLYSCCRRLISDNVASSENYQYHSTRASLENNPALLTDIDGPRSRVCKTISYIKLAFHVAGDILLAQKIIDCLPNITKVQDIFERPLLCFSLGRRDPYTCFDTSHLAH